MQTKNTYPKTVEYRGQKAVIYFQKLNGNNRYEVRLYDVDGTKQRTTFNTYEAAKEFAEQALREVVDNRANLLTLRGADAYAYADANNLLSSVGLSLRDAVQTVLECRRLLAGSSSIVEAVRYFVDNRPRKSPDITVRQVVDQLLDLKQREGSVGPLHMRDLRNRLGRFTEKFNCPIRQVSPPAIREYLLAQPVGERTRHNLRTTLAMLFNFADAEGYLPADHRGVPRPTKRRRVKLAVQIFTPEEMAKLIDSTSGEQRVALVIGGFAGIRAEELKRLGWQNLDFEQGHIVVPDCVAKTEERRIVPMTDNLRAWLQPLRQKTGSVCGFSNLAIVFQRAAHRAGIKWKRNALRHSFISYRVAIIKNVPQVAFEAGNSPVMIQRHYLKCVTESQARQWFNLFPVDSEKITPLPLSTPTEIASIQTVS